jgi:hypothetical protein
MLDGLLTFFGSHHAIRADKVLGDAGYESELIPGPKELSPNCGTAVRFAFSRSGEVLDLLASHRVEIDSVMEYRPRTDSWPGSRRKGASRR